MTNADVILGELDVLRDRRVAKAVSEAEYHSESDHLWDELRAVDRAEKEADVKRARDEAEQRHREERKAALKQTDPNSPYKTLKAAYADGWTDLREEQYAGDRLLLKGHMLVRHAKVAVSKTEWERRGYGVKDCEEPHAIISAHFKGSLKSWPVYREDQVAKNKTVTLIPPREIPLLQALWGINRYAKRCRDSASRYYETGCHGFAKSASKTKGSMYALKSQALHYLLADGVVQIVGFHQFPGGNWAEIIKGGGYTFHRPCPPQEAAGAVVADEIEAKPKSVVEPRLKDAIHTILKFLEGKPKVEVVEWPAKPNSGRSRLREWDDDEDDWDDDYLDDDNWEDE
jgi:hypothetical protein